jgi:hypothetical protein
MSLLQSFDCGLILLFKPEHLYFILFIDSRSALALEKIANTLLGLFSSVAGGGGGYYIIEMILFV